jgi:hypothetical protein
MFFAVSAIFMATYVNAQQNIGGVWRETSASEIKNSIVVVSQSGTDLTLCSSWEYRGTQIVWQGRGSINGGQVTYKIKHTLYPAGWGVEGTHKLELSSDGRSMSGTWTNTKGESGPLKFEKVR